LIGKYEKSEKKEEKKESKEEQEKPLAPDNWAEKNQIRPLAKEKAIVHAFNLFDVYKKAHDMPSYT